ncbi:hypothetical protein IGI04_008598 [Brassica rapa subsp. trilocularis]|uniref:Uncharacterized protein n=1 Tax=Brassica rapa subsp. trilocularis TaxID=1813537 RepID=A0ABQ7NN31_BRACM|nr:hypothetical protein IGI04_008598 [Brassica rapa subsp. trilocularis]
MAGKINLRELSSSSSPPKAGRRFRKVEESEHCEYANDYFVRGKPELTVEIEKQFKERCAPVKLDIKPPEPGYKEKMERMRALMLAQKAARRLS